MNRCGGQRDGSSVLCGTIEPSCPLRKVSWNNMSVLSTPGAPDISSGRYPHWIMAQTNSGGQGTNGVADESPNMIVYRKVSQHVHVCGACVCLYSSLDGGDTHTHVIGTHTRGFPCQSGKGAPLLGMVTVGR